MITELNAEVFRQKLAGLADASAGEDMFPDDYRELASDFVLLLAIGFNRRELDAVTLWSRIDSAIQKGLADCDGEDVDRFVSACLEHILAPINVVATHGTALEIQSTLTKLQDSQRAYFLQYLSRHRYAAIVLGREKWEQHKDVQKEAKRLLESEVTE